MMPMLPIRVLTSARWHTMHTRVRDAADGGLATESLLMARWHPQPDWNRCRHACLGRPLRQKVVLQMIPFRATGGHAHQTGLHRDPRMRHFLGLILLLVALYTDAMDTASVQM